MENPHIDAYQCSQGCNVFWIIGVASRCPYCGSSHVEPVDQDMDMYDNTEEIITNDGT